MGASQWPKNAAHTELPYKSKWTKKLLTNVLWVLDLGYCSVAELQLVADVKLSQKETE